MEWNCKNGNVKMPFGLTNKRWLRLGLPLFIGSSNPHEANKAWQHNTIWIEYNQIIWSHNPLQPSMARVMGAQAKTSTVARLAKLSQSITWQKEKLKPPKAGWSGWDVHKKHPLWSEINGANPRLNKNHIESRVMMSNGFAFFGQCYAMLSLLSFKPRFDALPRHQRCRKHHADVHNVHDDTTIVLSCTWVVEDPGFDGKLASIHLHPYAPVIHSHGIQSLLPQLTFWFLFQNPKPIYIHESVPKHCFWFAHFHNKKCNFSPPRRSIIKKLKTIKHSSKVIEASQPVLKRTLANHQDLIRKKSM